MFLVIRPPNSPRCRWLHFRQISQKWETNDNQKYVIDYLGELAALDSNCRPLDPDDCTYNSLLTELIELAEYYSTNGLIFRCEKFLWSKLTDVNKSGFKNHFMSTYLTFCLLRYSIAFFVLRSSPFGWQI